MTAEELREIAEQIRGFVFWAREEMIYKDVEITGYVELDLGVFGYHETEIGLTDDDYEFDPEDLVNRSPMMVTNFEEIAAALEQQADEMEAATVEQSFGSLAEALVSIASQVATAQEMLTPAVEGPQPWPGAKRTDIDYTAKDFPLKYQPPPGFAWASGPRDPGEPNAVEPDKAVRVPFSEINRHYMWLSNQGAVIWGESRKPTKGHRWLVWHLEREGIPRAKGFTGGDDPRAIDEHGDLIGTTKENWETPDTTVEAKAAVARLRQATAAPSEQTPAGTGEEFAPPAPVGL